MSAIVLSVGGACCVSTQYGYPVSDVTVDDAWDTSSGTDFWAMVDEDPHDSDTTYIRYNASEGTGLHMCEMKLGGLTHPGDISSSVHILHAVARTEGADDILYFSLRQGATLVATRSKTFSSSYSDGGDDWGALTSGEKSNITDYADLRIRCYFDSGFSAGNPYRVSMVSLEVQCPTL